MCSFMTTKYSKRISGSLSQIGWLESFTDSSKQQAATKKEQNGFKCNLLHWPKSSSSLYFHCGHNNCFVTTLWPWSRRQSAPGAEFLLKKGSHVNDCLAKPFFKMEITSAKVTFHHWILLIKYLIYGFFLWWKQNFDGHLTKQSVRYRSKVTYLLTWTYFCKHPQTVVGNNCWI